MSEFHVAFTINPSSISAPNGRLTIVEAPKVSAAPIKTYDAEAFAAIDCISAKLTELEDLLERRIDLMKQQISSLAIDVARAVVSDEELLIQKRVQSFVQAAFDQQHPSIPRTISVHPECLAPIQRWLQQGSHSGIEIKEDASILPGDCRIESGETGVAATLDAFLDLVFKQLRSGGENWQ
jgi:flagellar biosynthesis/type III secretory pathway protein FliH